MTIVWNEDQIKAVAQAAVAEYGAGDWLLTPATIINRVQRKVLPKELHRSITHAGAVTRYIRTINAVRMAAGGTPLTLTLAPSARAQFRPERTSDEKKAAIREADRNRKKIARDAARAALAHQSDSAPLPRAHQPDSAPLPRAHQPDRAPFEHRPDPAPKPAVPIETTIANALPALRDVASTLLADILVDTVKKLLVNGDIARMLQNLQRGQMPSAVTFSDPPAKAPAHSPFMATVNGAPASPRMRKTIVLVCGFMQSQQSQFINAFPNLQLRFWYTDTPNRHIDSLKDKARSADYVLFKMEATSHTATQVVESMGKRIRRVTGGATTMHTMLSTIESETPEDRPLPN